MAEVFFYHLTRSPLEATLPMLLEKSRAAGWRVLVRGGDAARLDWLDERLWLVPEDGFLPHGLAGGPHDSAQPVLLSAEAGPPANGAQALICVDGARADPAEIDGFTRVSILFDGNDAAAVAAARDQWRALTDAGAPARYWSQESGNWAEKASKNV
ncbi:DNA polymerase III subunit chi [Maritimibacter sp. 55A14]|uniref:DNA polymerase III subunit chi n=1 Tax=Maritimibacter sp. 55A14 TaxID=2174844 RepID=UPI000D617398|nr:DNA polymerase III subunit chi [Maritimibacter sp. 55A14]PWE34162.1 DNA polymerase III subunit chi [Maritimibacter sp. 55A14]